MKASELRKLKRAELESLAIHQGIDDAHKYPNKESLINDLIDVMTDPDPLNKIRHPKKRAFLSAYSLLGNVSDAARTAVISRGLHYHWLEIDTDYAEAFKDARESATDLLERHAVVRATQGVSRPFVHMGKIVTDAKDKPVVMTKYSDYLLMRLLEANRPEKYAPRQHLLIDMESDIRKWAIDHGYDPDEAVIRTKKLLEGGT